MNQILVYQAVVLFIISALSAVFAGVNGFWSSVVGGICYLAPSSIAVLVLKLSKCNPLYHGKAFIIGEVLKVVLSLVMMLAVFMVWHQSLIFLPFLFGLLSVSHLVFLVLLRVKHYGR
ncbi:ATP synthase subunit I [Neisseria sicca]|uniref:ATP synthase subunit I n=1 Tax=Neisseria sicca TaxID=490 RepID=UPI0002D915F2|nr:ATP synthase subunit I [Neisseria sicca]